MAIAYLIWKRRLTFDESFQLVKHIRPIVNPNPGFVFQMSEWAQTRLEKADQPAQAAYRIDIDEENCEKAEEMRPLVVGPLSQLGKDELQGKDCFVIVDPDVSYIWTGEKTTSQHRAACDQAVKLLQEYESIPSTVHKIVEGKEGEQFWSTIESLTKLI